VTEAATMPALPESGLQKEDAPPAVETRKLDSLNLTHLSILMTTIADGTDR